MASVVAGKIKYERGVKRLLISKIDKEEEKKTLYHIENRIGDKISSMQFLSMDYGVSSSKALFLEKDIRKHRLHCYIAAKLKILSRKRKRHAFRLNTDLFEMFESGSPDFIKFLMNNLEVLAGDDWDESRKRYSTLTNSSGVLFLMRTTLLAVKGDFKEVLKRCDAYLQKPLKDGYFKYREYEFGFFKALAEGDIESMREMLYMMLEPKVAKKLMNDVNPNYDFYLHISVIMYAKIALYHGIDLGIDSEVAPKELIDITPLESYEDPYGFMRGFDLSTVTLRQWEQWTADWL